jgi:hypothetical protein
MLSLTQALGNWEIYNKDHKATKIFRSLNSLLEILGGEIFHKLNLINIENSITLSRTVS